MVKLGLSAKCRSAAFVKTQKIFLNPDCSGLRGCIKNQHLNKLYFSISLQKLNNLFDKRTYLLHKTSKVLSIKIHTPYSFSEIGKRENNEDALFPQQGQADTHSRLFIVCDGMGGAEGGEIASQMTCDMISQYFEDYVKPDEDIETIEQHIHKALDLVFQNMGMLITDNFHLRKMGTTLALLYLHKGGVTVAHIGDSRIYFRQKPIRQR